MNVLLLSMPDSFEHMPTVAVRMPNGALCSLAGNIDAHHRVAAADLILVQHKVRETVERLVREIQPDMVGLSVMTFQRKTALRIIQLVRALRPAVRVVVGGYDPSLAPEAYMEDGCGIDYIVRGEGEITFRELLRSLESGEGSRLRFRDCRITRRMAGIRTRRAPCIRSRAMKSVCPSATRACSAATPCWGAAWMWWRPRADAPSTAASARSSRCAGATFTLTRSIACWPTFATRRDHGARAIFIVDDNISLNIRRFEALCRAIIDAGLNDIDYTVQAMTSPIAMHGETLAPLMRQAGFRYVFLGIENILEDDLHFLKAAAKNEFREDGRTTGNATLRAIEHLHRNKMYVVGGLIVGNPDDTRESIRANLEFAGKYVDWPYIQHPTPYPGTPMTKDFRARNLIVIDKMEEYDGTTAVVATQHLQPEEIEYERWRAERWMKTRHIPAVMAHEPLFVLRNWWKMLAHTFRGTSIKSLLGLESDKTVFQRYRNLRSAERVYL